MTVLLFGGNGQVGHELRRSLRALGDIVVTTARRMRSRVSPAIDTVTSGIEVSVIAPVDRYVRERAGSVFTSRDGREPRDKADG